MKLPLLSTLLLALTLLLGCSKKQEEVAPVPVIAANTGSYKLDGQLVTCSQVAVYEYPNRGNMGTDELQIQLLQPATASSPGDNMLLSFIKGMNNPVSAYSLQSVTHIIWSSAGPITRSFPANRQFTLSQTASGGYSGTFSSTSPGAGSVSTSTLTEGVFTNVHP